MRLQDLAQAIPGILVAVLLTGYAVATVLAPRWRSWEKLAAAPGLSAGFFGVLGLGLHLVHIPFEPLTVFPCVGVAAVVAVVRRRVSGPSPADGVPARGKAQKKTAPLARDRRFVALIGHGA